MGDANNYGDALGCNGGDQQMEAAAVMHVLQSSDRQPRKLPVSPHELKEQLKETEVKIKHISKRALNATPTAVALLIIFPLTIGIMMTWVVPIFLRYRESGIAANSAVFQGWVGCSNSASAISATTPSVKKLVQYKGISPSNLGQDFEEGDLLVGPGGKLYPVPACPGPDTSDRTAVLGARDQPYARLFFTFTKITPGELTASVDIRVELVNDLDPNSGSLLNQTAGVLTIQITPALTTSALSLTWTDRFKEWTGLKVPLNSAKPLTNYPWDVYVVDRGIQAQLVVYNGSNDGSLAATNFPQTRALPIQVYTQQITQLFDITVWSALGTSRMLQGAKSALPLHVEVTRTAFTRAYAIVVVILTWLIAGFNFVHIMDNIFVRPRNLNDWISPVLLVGLTAFRNTMPGIPDQMGIAIDMIGLVWPQVLVTLCVIFSFVAFIGQHTPGTTVQETTSRAEGSLRTRQSCTLMLHQTC